MSNAFKVCDQVPDGSRLEINVAPKEGAYATQVDLTISDSLPETFPHDEVVASGVRKILESPKAYVATVHVHCLGEVSINVSARVVGPDEETVCGEAWDIECSGEAPPQLFVLIARTRN